MFVYLNIESHHMVLWAEGQMGGAPIDAALRVAITVKILTDKIFIIALH